MSEAVLLRIEAPHFVAGVVIDQNDRVSRAAPIVGWTFGKSRGYVVFYCKRKNWRVETLYIEGERLPLHSAIC